MKFSFKNREYEYFIHPYNDSNRTERKVEVALLKEYIQNIKHFIEIGCVSPYYIDHVMHKVYDLSDDHPKAINLDADSLDLNNINILSISTIEHFGMGDYNNPVQKNKAINFLQKVLQLQCCKYLISWPLGYNLDLDEYVFSNIPTARYIVRDDNSINSWVEKTYNQLNEIDKTYGTFHCANAICVIDNSL
jgi:hypothetical protein